MTSTGNHCPYKPVSWSVVTAAVRPTPDDPRPVVAIALGAECKTYLKTNKTKGMP